MFSAVALLATQDFVAVNIFTAARSWNYVINRRLVGISFSIFMFARWIDAGNSLAIMTIPPNLFCGCFNFLFFSHNQNGLT